MLNDKAHDIWAESLASFKSDYPEHTAALSAVVDLAQREFEAQVERVVDPTDPRFEEWARGEARIALGQTVISWVRVGQKRRAKAKLRAI